MIASTNITVGNYESISTQSFTNTTNEAFDNETLKKQLDTSSICYASSEDFLSSTVFKICICVVYSTVFVVALIGNGLVCFVVRNSPRMKTVTNYFIVNLAVGDILMTIFCIPFSFVSMLILRYWPFGAVMCKIVNYSQAVSVFVSAYTLLAISLDRYMAIIRPLKPRLERTSAKLVVLGVWCGALATAGPIAFASEIKRPTDWHQICKADMCLENWSSPNQSHYYTCALMVLQFMLPLTALVFSYGRIAYVVWGGRPPGEALSERDTRMQRSKRKMVKMMVMVVAVFTICWLPLNVFIASAVLPEYALIFTTISGIDIFYILWTIHEKDEKWATWPGMPYVWFASHWLAMSHSCYNPIIYCYMNARYKRGYKQALSCLQCFKRDPTSRTCRRLSICEGMPLSDLVCANGVIRRGTTSSSSSQLHRAATCSSCASRRRQINMASGLGTFSRCSNITRPMMRNSKSRIITPPVRAASVRTHYK